ncbi:DASH complex subunit Hsk3 like-domain-containing protein [Hypoxylon sp. NC1633]|nr:DASH complex subunit Hsk3 like-domain-containing protein [Hypoxylon sp. NC1633]
MASRGGSGNMDRTTVMQGSGGASTRPSMAPQGVPAGSGSAVKARQLTHLHSQLAQLSANLADTENLLRMTSVQAEAMRGLGSWHGGLFMAASKVLGEESVREQAQPQGGNQK